MRGYPVVNKIATARVTRGTETSKYPEEEKEKSIPPVAASEKGGAQTTGDCGVADRPETPARIAEEAWKGPAERVTPPYAKCAMEWAAPE